MKMLFNYFPIIVFFATFHLSEGDTLAGGDMILATKAGIAAAFLQVSLFWIKYRRFERMHLIALAMMAVFGSITIALDDPFYIKWKTSILEWVFALVFLGSNFFGKHNLAKRMLGKVITAPENVWRKLNYAWVIFFVVMGFVNLYVLYNFSDKFWVNFKLFGMMGMSITFVIAQGIILAKYINQEGPVETSNETNDSDISVDKSDN